MDQPPARDDRTAIDKAISVLRAFGAESQLGIGVSELARRTKLRKSTTFRILVMLERNGAVERAGTAYRLGRLVDELGLPSTTLGYDLLRDALTPHLADLYVATHLTAQLAVLSRASVVCLNKLEREQSFSSPSRIGGHMPAYCTAVGKLLLAFDVDALEEALAQPRHAWTPRTLVDEEALRAELATVRRSGIALNRGESHESFYSMAAPILGRNGRPIAAFSIAGSPAAFRSGQHEATLRRIAFIASRAVVQGNALMA